VNFKRLHIFGGAGSGKTTLAKQYADKHGLVHRELDEIYYSNASTRQQRPRNERESLLSQIVEVEEWVIEGIFWQPWVQPALERADKIIVLAVPELTRHLRVVKRHLKLLPGAARSDWPTFFPTLIELLNHNRTYDREPLQETLQLVSNFDHKVSVCKTNTEAAEILELS